MDLDVDLFFGSLRSFDDGGLFLSGSRGRAESEGRELFSSE